MSVLGSVIGKLDPYGQIDRMYHGKRGERERNKDRLMESISDIANMINERKSEERQFERDKEKMELQKDLSIEQAGAIGDLSREDQIQLEEEMRGMGMPGSYTDPTTGKSYEWNTPEEFQMALQRANTDRAYWLNRASRTDEGETFDPFERMAGYIYQGFTEDAAYKNLYGGIADISQGLDREFASQNPELYNKFKDSVLTSINTDQNISDWERKQIRERALRYFAELENPEETQEAEDSTEKPQIQRDFEGVAQGIGEAISPRSEGLSNNETEVYESIQRLSEILGQDDKKYSVDLPGNRLDGQYSLQDIIDMLQQPNTGTFPMVFDQSEGARKILEEIIKQTSQSTGSGASGSF